MKKMFDTADGRTGAADPSAGALKRELRKQARRTRDAIDPAVRAAWSARIAEKILQTPAMEKAEHVLCYVSFGSEVMTDGIINHILEHTDKKVYIPKIIHPEKTQVFKGGRIPPEKERTLPEEGETVLRKQQIPPEKERNRPGGKPRPEMEFYRITTLQDLQASDWGIREPEGDPSLRFPWETYSSGPRQNDSRKEAWGGPAGKADTLLVLMPGVAFDRRRGRIGYGGGFYDRYLAALGGCRTIALAYSVQILDRVPVRPFDIRPDRIITETEEIC